MAAGAEREQSREPSDGSSSDGAVSATEAPGSSRLGEELRTGHLAPTIAAALLAWAMTVAPVGFSRATPRGTSVLAIAALVAGLAGPALVASRPRLGRHLGISLFLAFATATWLLGSAAIHPMRLDPTRGFFGAIAWGSFALSWSDRWGGKPKRLAPDPDAPLLLARSTLPFFATPLTALGILVSVGYLAFAFRIREPERALVAQALAVLCGVALVNAAAVVAISRGKPRRSSGRRLTPPALRALMLLFTFAIAGAIVAALR